MVAKVAPLVVIVGPTASGKTAFAIEIAKKYNGEIVAADSRTVYKGMDIGTAKPTDEEIKTIKHHLISVVQPNQDFNASDFKREANKAIEDIWSRGKLPIMVGGSGLYVNSVIYDYEFGSKSDRNIRSELNELSVFELQKRLQDLNILLPENSSNKRYLVRALEVGNSSKKQNVVRDNTLLVGIETDKNELKKRIEQRLEAMLNKGVVHETQRLVNNYDISSEPMKSNIYKVLSRYLRDEISLEDAKQEIIRSDMRLVKKQLTWFKRNKYINWGSPADLKAIIDNFVKNIN